MAARHSGQPFRDRGNRGEHARRGRVPHIRVEGASARISAVFSGAISTSRSSVGAAFYEVTITTGCLTLPYMTDQGPLGWPPRGVSVPGGAPYGVGPQLMA
jgi:hypothetical protein